MAPPQPVAIPDPVAPVAASEVPEAPITTNEAVQPVQPKEQVMTITAESPVAEVLSTVTELVSSPIFQAVLPLLITALEGGAALSNPVSAASFGAQFIIDLAGILPKLDGPALQSAVTLVEGLLTAKAPAAPAAPVTTPNSVTVATVMTGLSQNQVPTIEGTVTQ